MGRGATFAAGAVTSGRRCGCRGAADTARAGFAAAADFELGAFGFAPTFFAAGFAAGFPGFGAGFAAGFLGPAFLAAGLVGFGGLRPDAAPADFFTGFAADLRTGFAEPRAFPPCLALLPEVFFVLDATHRLLTTGPRTGYRSCFNVAR